MPRKNKLSGTHSISFRLNFNGGDQYIQSVQPIFVRSMAIYQTSKQLTKFTISGLIAVAFDFGVYYGLSNLFGNSLQGEVAFGLIWNDIFKACGFLSGTVVTYNLNKFWTWRQSDKNQKRLYNFFILYAISFVLNILANKLALGQLHDNEVLLFYRQATGDMQEFFALKTDKLVAFVFATAISSIVNFVGQKIWVFNSKGSATIEADSE